MAFLLGVLASFFFSVTFVLNQSMASSGGDWLWTASLRFLFMMPFFLIIVIVKRNSQLRFVFHTIKENWKSWFLWSQVAFGLFYIPLCFASSLAPGWLIASTWQITIIAGSVLAPFLEPNLSKRKQSRISKQDGFIFSVILLGIVIIELQHMALTNVTPLLVAFIAVLIAAVAYPLGNRKIMIVNHHTANLNTDERILAMLVCSLPTWLVCSIIGFVRSGVPETAQVASSFLVALFSGVIAT
ncbi:MAG: multidrug resistance efflux transporter family protein, partial [Lactococcus sp.]|nr:multidrug resistance efflux transporter family protein [Lactococcus sp.]